MSDKKPTKFFRTCKNCGHDNSDEASKCNSCAKSLTGGFSDKYHARWGCPDCGTINMKENAKCAGCDYKVPGCFLTTACVTFAAMPDDCEMLTLMRKLRDGYVTNLPEGKQLIAEYYEISPKIVEAIDGLGMAEKNAVYESMLISLGEISYSVKSGNYVKAKELYMEMYAQTRCLLKDK
jgi:hypothetical protein